MYSDTQALNPEWPSARTLVGRYHAEVSVDSPEPGHVCGEVLRLHQRRLADVLPTVDPDRSRRCSAACSACPRGDATVPDSHALHGPTGRAQAGDERADSLILPRERVRETDDRRRRDRR